MIQPAPIPVRRVLEPADAAAYYDIRIAADAEYPEHVGYSAERELLTGRAKMQDLLERYAEGTTVFGSWAGGSLIAVAVTQNRSSKYVHRGFLWGCMWCRPVARPEYGERL